MATSKGKYRLSAWGSTALGYVGALICNDHDHPTFEAAQDCVLLSLQTGRPEVVEEPGRHTEPTPVLSALGDTVLALPEDVEG